jgi:hypothetical protein
MNASAINRIIQKSESSTKSHKGKIMSGKRARSTKQYFKETAARARRKQGKAKYEGEEGAYYRRTTHRREEQPDPEDLRLEDIHFANFLGSKCEEGIPYNSMHIDEPVNIIECDMYLKSEPSKNVAEKEEKQEEKGHYINLEEYLCQRQIEREKKTVPHMDLVYIPETKTITSNGWYFKRGRDDATTQEDARPTKRTRHDKITDAINADLEAIVRYMEQQVKIATEMMKK